MEIHDVLKSGDVERFHNAVGISKQLNSSHSWGVALLCQYFDPNCSKELILAAIVHDCAEFKTGDLPAPVKWKYPEIRDIFHKYEKEVLEKMGIKITLTPEETALLKTCDRLEGMRYCVARMEMGEHGAIRPFFKWYNFLNAQTMTQGQKLYRASLCNQMEDLIK